MFSGRNIGILECDAHENERHASGGRSTRLPCTPVVAAPKIPMQPTTPPYSKADRAIRLAAMVLRFAQVRQAR
jgi:hypothetical protein